jgi:RNA polymerase sigma-70 factor (ECF subfamily)
MFTSQLEFQNIYTDFQPKILRYLCRLVGEDEAEDLAQETFVKVGSALDSFRGESKLSTWLYRVATNTAIDRLRSPAFQRASEEVFLEDPLENCGSQADDRDPWTGEKKPSVEQKLVRDEMNACLLGQIEKLPEIYRTVFVLSELEGLANQEITEILGVTIDTVKIRLHRAREKLRDQILSHCEFYWVEELSWQAF